jgi:preprotein translocase subunit SecY
MLQPAGFTPAVADYLRALVVFRLIAHVPIPGVNAAVLEELFLSNSLLGMFDLFSGALCAIQCGSHGRVSLHHRHHRYATHDTGYSKLQALAKEGEAGRNKINLYTHWMTVPLAAFAVTDNWYCCRATAP